MLIEEPTPAEVVAAVARVPAGAWIAVDADGTLWDGDVGDDVMRAAAADAEGWRAEVDLDAYLARLETDYHGACTQSAKVAWGAPRERVFAGLRALLDGALHLRRYLVDALLAARERGVEVRVVSASPRLAVEATFELFTELSALPIIALEHDDAGRPVTPQSIGEGKPAAWRARGLPDPALAFGDSKWDLPMLRAAEVGMRLVPADRDPQRDASAADVSGHAPTPS